MRRTESIDTVIVGAGQAGLSMSYHLVQRGWPHVVLERGNGVGSTWRRERWDSFKLVTPNWQLQLPGFAYQGGEPDGFLDKEGVLRYLAGYAASFDPPIKTGVEVRRVTRSPRGEGYTVLSDDVAFEARNVVMANGAFPVPSVPRMSAELPARVHQIHSSQYKNPRALPEGAVLVVGSGQSGTQIAQELARSGRKVYLSVGSSLRTVRSYRGKDSSWWRNQAGLYDVTVEELAAAGKKPITHPYIGIDLPALAQATGMTLLGRVEAIRGRRIELAPDLNRKLMAADAELASFMRFCDDLAASSGLDLPLDTSPPPPATRSLPEILELDLDDAGVEVVVWSTGYAFDAALIDLPVWDEAGRPVQRRGVTACRGLYFLGLHYMHTQKSGLLFGVGDDAGFLASHITAR